MYTKFTLFKKNVNDTKTSAKVYTGKEMNIPFYDCKEQDIFYTVFSENFIFTYNENAPDDIFITYIKPNKNLSLRVKVNNNFLKLNTKTTIKSLGKYFKNSVYSLMKDKKHFRLLVKKDSRYAFCDLVFKNGYLSEMYLEK
ncbi:hypothetical protein AMQ68_02900 [Chryseobacterium sp. ERMR1:04]|nr:hypothetical protein AMQ68_02900 [Chryseobacterium sp. ERMR1:04]